MCLHKIRADLDRALIFQPRVEDPPLLLVGTPEQVMGLRRLRRPVEDVSKLDDGVIGLSLSQILLTASEVLYPLRLRILTAARQHQAHTAQKQEPSGGHLPRS